MNTSPTTRPAAPTPKLRKDFWVDQFGRRWSLAVEETAAGLAIREAALVDAKLTGSEFYRLLNDQNRIFVNSFYKATAGVGEEVSNE